ncbi:MAG: CGNR zinc finger domain-containing protein, partial [Chloroflexota bacterium]
MVAEAESAGTLDLVGGALALDYANTVDWHDADQPWEWLKSYDDLVAWSRHSGILTPAEATQLLAEARRAPASAEAVLSRALTLREAIFRVFSGVAQSEAPQAADLALLNDELSEAMAKSRVVPTEGGFAWDWADKDAALDRMLWPVVRSAAELLVSKERKRLRKCEGHPCGWLFLDFSKNHSRRWCDMKGCGNRAKARRHYQRARS